MTTTTTSTTQQITTTRTATTNTGPQLLFPTSQTLLTDSKDFAKRTTYKCTSKVQTLLGHPWLTPRTRTINQTNRSHLSLPVPSHQLFQLLHWGVWQIPRGQSQGTLKGPLLYTPPQHHNRTSSGPFSLQHHA